MCLDDRWAAWHVLSSKLDVLSGQPGLPQTSNRCPAKSGWVYKNSLGLRKPGWDASEITAGFSSAASDDITASALVTARHRLKSSAVSMPPFATTGMETTCRWLRHFVGVSKSCVIGEEETMCAPNIFGINLESDNTRKVRC